MDEDGGEDEEEVRGPTMTRKEHTCGAGEEVALRRDVDEVVGIAKEELEVEDHKKREKHL